MGPYGAQGPDRVDRADRDREGPMGPIGPIWSNLCFRNNWTGSFSFWGWLFGRPRVRPWALMDMSMDMPMGMPMGQYSQICMRIHAHACTHAHMHACVCIRICVCLHLRVSANIPRRLRASRVLDNDRPVFTPNPSRIPIQSKHFYYPSHSSFQATKSSIFKDSHWHSMIQKDSL